MATPKGLFYLTDVLTPKQESELIQWLDAQAWSPLTIRVDTGRLVQQYGYRFDYHTHDIKDDVPPIPPILSDLERVLVDKCRELKLIVEPTESKESP